MKLLKSTSTSVIKDLPTERCVITSKVFDPERLWVAHDRPNNLMYFINHHAGLGFVSVPTWGAEFPIADEVDIDSHIGQSPGDLVLTIHPEAWDNLKDFINVDSNQFDVKAYSEFQRAL